MRIRCDWPASATKARLLVGGPKFEEKDPFVLVVTCRRPLYIGSTTDAALRIDERRDRESESRPTLKSAKEVDIRSRSDKIRQGNYSGLI